MNPNECLEVGQVVWVKDDGKVRRAVPGFISFVEGNCMTVKHMLYGYGSAQEQVELHHSYYFIDGKWCGFQYYYQNEGCEPKEMSYPEWAEVQIEEPEWEHIV